MTAPTYTDASTGSGSHRISQAVSRLFRISARAKHEMAQRDPAMRDLSVMLVLSALVERGSMRSSDLADCLRLDPSQVSRHIATAVRDGLVERRADPDDGRATLLAPTPLGRDRNARFAEMRTRQLDQVTADWDAVDVDRFAGLFERFVTAFDQTLSRGGAPNVEHSMSTSTSLPTRTSQQEIA